jgi:hypothetical protein
VNTDTLVVDNQDFSTFSSPGECVAAAKQKTEMLRRSLAMQYYSLFLRDTAPELDTLPRQVVALARACGARFTLMQTTPMELPVLFTLALLEGNDTLAHAIVLRRLSLATNGPARQMVLAETVSGYVDAEPARLAAAEWAAVKADTLAIREHTNSLQAHIPLLEIARRTFDVERIEQEAFRIVHLGQTLDFHAIEHTWAPVITAWRRLLEVAFVYHPDSVLIDAQAAKTDLSRFPPDPMVLDFKTATVTKVRNYLLPFTPDRYTTSRVLPPVHASFWFPTSPQTWPPHGHVSLVLYGINCARGEWGLLGGRLTLQGCGGIRTYLRRWAEQYDSLGFALTLIDGTRGYAALSGVLAPADEADSLNWYYRTYLHLPVRLGVVQRVVVKKIAQPDGRRWYADTTAFGRMLGTNPYNQDHQFAMLFGPDGALLYAGDLDRSLLNALILHALNAPVVVHKSAHTTDVLKTASIFSPA